MLLNRNKIYGGKVENLPLLDEEISETLKANGETKTPDENNTKTQVIQNLTTNQTNKSVLLIESDTSFIKNENISEMQKSDSKNLKRGRNTSVSKEEKPQKKRKTLKNPNGKNGNEGVIQIEVKENEEIPQFHHHNQNNLHNILMNGKTSVPINNYQMMGNYNHFINANNNLEAIKNHENNNNYLLFAQKMMVPNGNYVNSYNEILNKDNLFPINKN